VGFGVGEPSEPEGVTLWGLGEPKGVTLWGLGLTGLIADVIGLKWLGNCDWRRKAQSFMC
jgi:hypothetical protein